MADTGELDVTDLISSDVDISDGKVMMRKPHCLVTNTFSATQQIILRPLNQMPGDVIPVTLLLNTQSLSSALVQPKVVHFATDFEQNI